MDILAPRHTSELHDDVRRIMKALQFGHHKLGLKGSSSYKSQQYFSDYDFFTPVKQHYTAEQAYRCLHTILEQLRQPFVYVIEIKLQTKHNQKIRWHYNDPFTYPRFAKHFPDVKFVKIDLVARINGRFKEVSSIYDFGEKSNEHEYVASLKKDIDEYAREKKYYKVLKRMFNLYRVEGDTKSLLKLSHFFNSDIGRLYQDTANLEAIKTLETLPLSEMAKKAIKYNKKEIKNFDIKKNEKVLNTEAKQFLHLLAH